MRNIDVLTILVDQVDQEFSKICGHSVNRHPIIRPSPFQAGSPTPAPAPPRWKKVGMCTICS